MTTTNSHNDHDDTHTDSHSESDTQTGTGTHTGTDSGSGTDERPSGERSAGGQPPRSGPRTPQFPLPVLEVRPWDDPVLDELGVDPRSPYVERYWTSILGPSATLLIRRFAARLEQEPAGFTVDSLEWAQELGLGTRGGKNGPFWRALDRTSRFGATQRNGQVLMVRRRLPPLNLRQVDRLPPHLQQAHRAWSARQLLDHQGTRGEQQTGDPSVTGPSAA